jgi:VanZ family protein
VPKDPLMRFVARMACFAYWILLTTLLLTPNPAALMGLHKVPILPWGKFGIHLTAFTILSILVHASRWPKRPHWPMLFLLMLYGIATESLQILVPPRTSRVMDGVENCLGILAGAAIYWLLLQLVQPLTRPNLASQLVEYATRDSNAE